MSVNIDGWHTTIGIIDYTVQLLNQLDKIELGIYW